MTTASQGAAAAGGVLGFARGTWTGRELVGLGARQYVDESGGLVCPRYHPVMRKKDPWPFDQPRNCATFTLRSIVFDGEPILHVVHDADDHGWQFLDGKPIDMANVALVSLEEIVKQDPSVLELADMPPGWSAMRSSKTAPWRRISGAIV